jgi:soluble lytic murein transglycosylase-like protein
MHLAGSWLAIGLVACSALAAAQVPTSHSADNPKPAASSTAAPATKNPGDTSTVKPTGGTEAPHQAAESTQTTAEPTQPVPLPAARPAAAPTNGKKTDGKEPKEAATKPPTPDDICRAIEQDAAENDLPVEFFARVIWQESRFNAQAVSDKGAEGIAQFMPATASFRGLADPFDPIAALRESASYLGDLKKQFGNLGLAAAGYNAGPGRVSAWLDGRRGLPAETRDYVAVITGWTADEWTSPSPPKMAETTIPQGVPCTRLANLILAKPQEQMRIATYVPAWGAQLTASLSEAGAWAVYRVLHKRYAALIGDREPVVLRGRIPGMGSAARYMIRISDDNRSYLEKFCQKLMSAGGACVVLRNQFPRATAVN